jgi:hypothetical protein
MSTGQIERHLETLESTRTNGRETMTRRSDATWECSAGCPLVFMVDEHGDDVAFHLHWHDDERARSVSSIRPPDGWPSERETVR